MNLTELYARTPVEEHKNILVEGGKVYVLGADGTDEYVVRNGELVLVHSDKASEERIIKKLVTSPDGRMGDIKAIRTKLGA